MSLQNLCKYCLCLMLLLSSTYTSGQAQNRIEEIITLLPGDWKVLNSDIKEKYIFFPSGLLEIKSNYGNDTFAWHIHKDSVWVKDKGSCISKGGYILVITGMDACFEIMHITKKELALMDLKMATVKIIMKRKNRCFWRK